MPTDQPHPAERGQAPLRLLEEALTLSRRTRELMRRGAWRNEHRLCDQLCGACDSVRANIVEGRARPTRRDTRRYLGTAWASLREYESHLDVAHAARVYPESGIAELRQRARWVGRLLAGLRRHYATD